MTKKIINLIILICLAISLLFLDHEYPRDYFYKGFLTFLVISIIYLVLKIIFEEIGVKQIKEPKSKYSFKKTISILFIIFVAGALIGIWIENTDSIMLAYGLMAAGIVITLQDFFKNFVGGVTIFVTGIYKVGDRIEIDNKVGDVIDIDIMYTTLMELRAWVAGDQATGRLIIIPNGYVLTGSIFNYTKDHNYIWDEIVLPITYDSNWKKAYNLIIKLVKQETFRVVQAADKSISQLGEKYYLTKRVAQPAIFMKLTDNWIEFYIRYTTEVRQRRVLHDRLNRRLLKAIQAAPDIKIASTTLDITAFPEVKIQSENSITK
jgi:small-conductance mechanosensitive channel